MNGHVVADGLAPIWRQAICNHIDGVACAVRHTVSQRNVQQRGDKNV